MRLHHVQAAQPADPLVALLDLAAHVPRAAADLPFVHAGIAAEGPALRRDRSAAPPADRPALLVSLGLAPLIRRHHPPPSRCHDGSIAPTRLPRAPSHLP